mmetsp:Transcript_24305/g.35611  ORF Transcript_24305/g.35611 Transcript_24305/m.35611 type:complete len:801 (+) Transcript_24305:22-2424(+)
MCNIYTVQNIIEKVRRDFHVNCTANDKLRKLINQKKQLLHAYLKKTGECCSHLGSVGAQVSVYEHKFADLVKCTTSFEKSIEELCESRLSARRRKFQSASDIEHKMSSDLKQARSLYDFIYNIFERVRKVKCNIEYKLNDLQEKREKLTSCVSDIAEEIQVVNQRNQKLRENVRQHKDNVDVAEQDMNVQEHKKGDILAEIDNANFLLTRLKNDIQTQKQIVAETHCSWDKKIQDLKVEIDTLTSSLNEHKKVLEETVTFVEEKEKAIDILKSEKEEVLSQRADVSTRLKAASESLVNVESDLSCAVKERDDLHEKIKVADSELDLASKAIETAEKDLYSRMESVRDVSHTYYELKKEEQALECQIQEIELAAAVVLQEYEVSACDCDRNLLEAVSELNSQELKIEALKEDLSCLSERHAEVCTKKDLIMAEIISLEREIETLRKRKEETDASMNSLRASMDEIKDHSRYSLDVLSKSYDENAQSIETLGNELAVIRNEIALLDSSFGMLSQFIPDQKCLSVIHERVNKEYALWVQSSQAAHDKELSEMESQTAKLFGGSALLFPDIVISRSHELSQLKGTLVTLKKQKEQESLGTLVSHIQVSIDTKNGLGMKKGEKKDLPVVETSSQLSPGIDLSPVEVRSTRKSLSSRKAKTFNPRRAKAQSSKSVVKGGPPESELHDGNSHLIDSETDNNDIAVSGTVKEPKTHPNSSFTKIAKGMPPPSKFNRQKRSPITASSKQHKNHRTYTTHTETRRQKMRSLQAAQLDAKESSAATNPSAAGSGDWFFDDTEMSFSVFAKK